MSDAKRAPGFNNSTLCRSLPGSTDSQSLISVQINWDIRWLLSKHALFLPRLKNVPPLKLRATICIDCNVVRSKHFSAYGFLSSEQMNIVILCCAFDNVFGTPINIEKGALNLTGIGKFRIWRYTGTSVVIFNLKFHFLWLQVPYTMIGLLLFKSILLSLTDRVTNCT